MWAFLHKPIVGVAGKQRRISFHSRSNTTMAFRLKHVFQFVAALGMLVMVMALPAAATEPNESRAPSDHAIQSSHLMAQQEDVTIADDPTFCIADVKGEVLGSTPSEIEGYSLVSARVTFAPGGTIGAHIHPGTLVATVVEGSLGFTLITDAQMSVSRAPAADGSRAIDAAFPGQEVVLTPGDGFVETGMVHSARNTSDGQTVVMISGLIKTGQPLTQCVAQ
jgi:quercetin dioxygenase-like cupin family protein